MLIVLFVSLVILSVFSFFLFKKNILSPSFLLSSIFSIGALLALVGNTLFWQQNISYKGPLIIILSIMVFILGEFLVDYLIGLKHKEKQETTPTKSGEVEFSIGTMIFLLCGFVFSLAINFLVFKKTMALAREYGYKSGFYFLPIVRQAFHAGHRLPIYVSILDFVVQGLGFVCIFLGIRQLFGGKKRFAIFYALPLIPLIISQFLSTGRNGFILDAVLIVLSITYFGVVVYKKVTALEIFLIAIIAINLFIVMFFAIGFISTKYKNTADILSILCVYGGSSIVAFDVSLNSTGIFEPAIFGSYTFNGFYGLLSKFIPSLDLPARFLNNIQLLNGRSTNIYTTFGSFYADFGMIGTIVISFISGSLFSLLKNASRTSKSSLLQFLFIYYLYDLVYSLFNPLFGNFLSVTQIMQVAMIIFFYAIIIYSGKVLKALRKHKIAGDIIFAFITQGVSFLLSLTMSLIVPKLLSTIDYSYWQLFIFYSTYVGIFHFGFIDGVYLRLGGKNPEELDRRSLTSQFIVFGLSQIILSGVACAIWCSLVGDSNRIFVILFTAVYLIFSNLGLFFGYIFQCIGKVKTYSMSIFIEKLLFLLSIIVLFVLRIEDFRYFILLYVFYRLVFFVYLIVVARKYIIAKPSINKGVFKEIWLSTKRGFSLMIASLASLLIMGLSRGLIDLVWGIESFGKFSFSISLCSFAIAFLSQVSMVFFPALRKIDEEKQVKTFKRMKKFTLLFLPLSYFAYFLLKGLVNVWLPNYVEAIRYMVILLPICIYDGKMQMIFTTYFKVLNKEKQMLFVNLGSLLLSASGALVFAFAIPNIFGVIISAVVGIVIRSLISDIYLSKVLKTPFIFELLFEGALTATFVVTTLFLPGWASFLSLTAVYVALLVFERKTIYRHFSKLAKKVKSLVNNDKLEEKTSG